MSVLPVLLAAVLLVLAVAFGLHCLLLHCDPKRHIEPVHDHVDSAARRPRP